MISMLHTCNAWCQRGEHADVFMVSNAVASEAQILDRFTDPYYAASGRRLLGARRALEADRDAIITAKKAANAQGVSTAGTIRTPTDAQYAATDAWVIRWAEDDGGQACIPMR
jgi:hypothetical protein